MTLHSTALLHPALHPAPLYTSPPCTSAPQEGGEAPVVAESADVEIYKNFIREQDARMNQFVEANSVLKVVPPDFFK